MVSDRRIFGERLKRHRERGGVTLDAIAQTTKVPGSLFAGLERGDCSRWPAGVYSRGYVRAYAEAIGLDGDEVVEEFTSLFGALASPDAAASVRRPRTAPLRLSMDDEPAVRQERAARRAALAIADLSLAALLAWLAHTALGTALWTTVAIPLAYYATGRVLTDEPLIAWLFHRFRSTSTSEVDVNAAEEVPVRDPAGTTA